MSQRYNIYGRNTRPLGTETIWGVQRTRGKAATNQVSRRFVSMVENNPYVETK